MARFKRVAIKNQGEDIYDDLYQYEEPELKRNDMDLSKVNFFIHRIMNLTGFRQFRIRVYYGTIADDGSFQSIEERFNDDEIFTDLSNLNMFFEFEYLPGYNHLKLEILEGESGDT